LAPGTAVPIAAKDARGKRGLIAAEGSSSTWVRTGSRADGTSSKAHYRACITTAIINGRKPPQLTAKTLMRLTPQLPAGWAEQRKLLDFR
jgi:hypothetical protein